MAIRMLLCWRCSPPGCRYGIVYPLTSPARGYSSPAKLPEIVSGTPVFAGTRVPVEALLENLAAGVTLDEFLDNFPTVSRAQVLAVLAFSNQTLKKLGQAR